MELETNIYINKIIGELIAPVKSLCLLSTDETKIPEQIFSVLSSKEFTYLTKKRAQQYKQNIIDNISKFYSDKKPIHLFLVLGGGYRAKIMQTDKLTFSPGLGDLLALFQIKKFINKASHLYPFGVIFTIILDNRCAEISNAIPIINTKQYAVKLRDYIKKLNLAEEINVILQSDFLDKKKFKQIIQTENIAFPISQISDTDIINAKRFNNVVSENDHHVSVQHYKIVNKISRRLIAEHIRNLNGILLYQRSNEDACAFRSFPGGDSKIQCGEVVLLYDKEMIKRPLLITSENFMNYDLFDVKLFDNQNILPKVKVAKKK